MRIVFFGTPDIALPSLYLANQRHTVTAVVCQPDKPVGRKKTPQSPPVKVWAEENNIPVHQPTKLGDGAFDEWLRNEKPDACVLVAYGRILRQASLDIPEHGFINVHPSLLPKHRGPSPIHTAVLEGDTETGVTIMKLDSGTDTGDIMLQQTMALPPNATTEEMAAELAALGAEMAMEVLGQIEGGTAVYVQQDDSLATHTRMFVKFDGAINWNLTAEDIHNQIRASLPWPVAYCKYNDQPMRIHKSTIAKEIVEAMPGTIIRIEEDSLVVACGKYAVSIEALQAAGKKVNSVADYQRGNPFQVGDTFGDG
jgi:methionyl-tRNA formyltransferase